MESAATLDVLAALDACTQERITPGKELLIRIVAMLSRLSEVRSSVVREELGDYERSNDDDDDDDDGRDKEYERCDGN